MLVWGSRTESRKIGQTPAFECPSCHTNAPHDIVQTYSWGHLWYLGALGSKSYTSVCSHCRLVTPLDGAKVERDFSKLSYPFHHKFGWLVWVVLIGAMTIGGAVASHFESETTSIYVTDPVVGDLYALDSNELDTEKQNYHYGVFKVKSVDADSVEFLQPKYAYELASGVRKEIDRVNDASFTTETIRVPRKKLLEMKEKGGILTIHRNEANLPH